MEQSFSDFDKELRRVHDKRTVDIFKVFYIKHIYRDLIKTDKIIKNFTCEQMYNILYDIGTMQIDNIMAGEIVRLPYGMGELYIACDNTIINYKKDEDKVTGLKINWFETKKFWYEHPEAREKGQYIKFKPCKFFSIKYKRGRFVNKKLYKLHLIRPVKLRLRDAVLSNELINAYEYRFNKFEKCH